MNAPKPSPWTAASSTFPPRPPPPPRGAKPTAPFTPFARDRAAPAEPAGDAPPAEAPPAASLAASLDRWMALTSPPVTGPLAHAPQQPPEGAPAADAKSPHVDAPPPDTSEPHPRTHAQDDPLDPMLRQPGLFAPQIAVPQATTPAPTPDGALLARASTSLEELLPQLVRKIAWSGDGKRGAVRMELGAGALAGSTLMLESEGGRIRVQLDAPPGVDGEAWKRRIGARLAEKRIDVESIEVR